ncbi:hypothetical protein NLI96_g12825 [Meripilus lineatus]|uniref:CCHC-type domain-containing protein n=1 Tax=Meripilus lineatus TaxID=2056292 RepID=A0AAD5URK4_9APHY|nr:hypothetical protein NLI96_g12825 [Physisporinus lineatus]
MSQTTVRGGQTGTQRGVTPALATRSQNPALATALPPASRKRPRNDDPSDDAPRDTDPIPDPPAGGPSGNAGGGGGGGNDPNPGPDPGADDDGDNGNPGRRRNSGDDLIDAITTLTRSINPPRTRAKPKVKEPDTFDGSDPKKLDMFLIQCGLYFRNYPDYEDEELRVNFALTYLRGVALEWFEPTIFSLDDLEVEPEWLFSWPDFTQELRENFGVIDPRGDAEDDLDELKMKDNAKINRYNVAFNRLAAKLGYPPEVLRHRYYKGLPDRIKDVLSCQASPKTFQELKVAAHRIDARYWERQREKTRTERSKPKANSSGNSGNSGNNSGGSSGNNSKGSGNSSAQTNSSGSGSNSGSSSNSRANNSKAAATPSHLGKDGKLTPAERKRRMDNKLCMFCAAPGHMAKDCTKTSSSAAKGRAATVATDSGSKTDSKK